MIDFCIDLISCFLAKLLVIGLKKVNSFRIHEENACIMGMIAKVKYLVKVEKICDGVARSISDYKVTFDNDNRPNGVTIEEMI